MPDGFRSPGPVLVLLLLPLMACGEDPAGIGPALARTCGARGVLHAGAIGSERWGPEGNPHAVVDTLRVTDVLTIEPGVEVCVEPGTPILTCSEGSAIEARGTAEAPIVFTAGDPAEPWGGIFGCSSSDGGSLPAAVSVFSHVRIEHAAYGVLVGGSRIDHVHFRQIGCTAASTSHIAYSRVDTAGIKGCPAVLMGGAASQGGIDRFEETTIVGSGGIGLQFVGYGLTTSGAVPGSVALLGGRIEGSRGTGLHFDYIAYKNGHVSEARPLRITGGAGIPVRAHLGVVAQVWPTAADQDSLRGNAADSVVVWSGKVTTPVVVGGGITMKVISHFFFTNQTSIESEDGLRIEPGGELVLETILWVRGPLLAEGTPDDPVRISGHILALSCTGTSPDFECDFPTRLTNARLEDVHLSGYGRSMVLQDITARNSVVEVGAGSTLTHAVFEDAPRFGLEVGSDVLVSDCAIRRSGKAGIVVRQATIVERSGKWDWEGSTGVTIHDCALEDNGGPGVRNLADDEVDARFNWWGDPAGPLGPAGDGVEGAVDFSEYRTAPPA